LFAANSLILHCLYRLHFEMISEVLNRLDNIQESISHVVKRIKTKNGSQLGKSEVACFARATVAMNELLPYVENLTSDYNYQYVYTEARKYTEIMMGHVVAQRIAEIPYVQQPTFALMKLLTAHIIPDLQFFEKDNGAIEIKYCIVLQTLSAELLPVNGETDQLIATGEIPLGNIEVKSLDMTCTTPKEIGEILAEDKGFAERYKRILGIEPHVFPSVLVSGRRWAFVDRLFLDGDRYIHFPVLETFDVTTTSGTPCECKINEPNLMMVSQMLVRMIYSIRDLARITRKRKLQLFSHAAADDDKEEQNSDEPSDDDDDDDDENADDPPLKKRAAGSSVTARGIHNTKANGSREKGKHSQSSSLTMANVFQHDRNTLWQRTIVR